MTFTEAWERLPPEAPKTLIQISDRIAKEFFYIAQSEDLYSDFLIYLGEHPNVVNHWLYEDDDGNPKFGWKSFRRDAAAIMAKSARKQKAHSIGYDPDDEVFYGRQQVQELLEYMWHDRVLAADGPDSDHVSTYNDPAHGGDRRVSIMDVTGAYKKAIREGGQWDRILTEMYGVGRTQREIAGGLGITQQSVSRTHGRAIDAILQELNGTVPIRDDRELRKVMSNAQAAALTDRQEMR